MNSNKSVRDADDQVTVVRSDELEHIPVVCVNYRNLTITRRDKSVRKLIKSRLPDIKDTYGSGNWANDPVFKGYVELHDRHSGEKGLAGSSQALIEFVLKNGFLPNINSFVDMYNLVSVLTGISIGAHDIKALHGTPGLELLKRDMPFTVIGANQEAMARKGEYCYVDEAGILCRMDIKQCERSKVNEVTTDVLVIFQGHESLDAASLEEGVRLLDQLWTDL